MERAGAQQDRFEELVSEGWLRAWETLEGVYDGFLRDLMRAWKQADSVGAQVTSTQKRSCAIFA